MNDKQETALNELEKLNEEIWTLVSKKYPNITSYLCYIKYSDIDCPFMMKSGINEDERYTIEKFLLDDFEKTGKMFGKKFLSPENNN